MSGDCKKLEQARVCSIGVDADGKCVIRIAIPQQHGVRVVAVDTNVVSFATLAHAGLPVVNGYR